MISAHFVTKKGQQNGSHGKFVMEPLPLSFGNSIGNALRRTLLSSLKGASITQVKISGSPHLFSPLKGVKESALELVLNLQQLKFETPREGSLKVTIEEKGPKKITGKDIKGEATVVNKDLYIGNVTDSKTKLEVEAYVETGIGSLTRDEIEKKESGYIALDAYFSPVKRVNFKIEEARVGRKSIFDRLILEIGTDGTVTPETALKQASSILREHFEHILSGKDVPAQKEEEKAQKDGEIQIDPKYKDVIIDELNLPSRVINALLRESIETIADLVKVGRDKLIDVKGLGKKSYLLIEEELKKMGIEMHS